MYMLPAISDSARIRGRVRFVRRVHWVTAMNDPNAVALGGLKNVLLGLDDPDPHHPRKVQKLEAPAAESRTLEHRRIYMATATAIRPSAEQHSQPRFTLSRRELRNILSRARFSRALRIKKAAKGAERNCLELEISATHREDNYPLTRLRHMTGVNLYYAQNPTMSLTARL
jgi:hypothetical protein